MLTIINNASNFMILLLFISFSFVNTRLGLRGFPRYTCINVDALIPSLKPLQHKDNNKYSKNPHRGQGIDLRRCLDACPTNAFVGPYVLDARKCISYLTTELKGAIPHELRPLMGAHIFGCDICQDVCPYNTKCRPTTEPAFQPRPGLCAPELVPLLRLTEAEFRAKFRGSPILRAKRRGFLRNVCVALGSFCRVDAVPALVDAVAADPEPLVRAHAAWALGRIGRQEAKAALGLALRRESVPPVSEEIRLAVGSTASRQ